LEIREGGYSYWHSIPAALTFRRLTANVNIKNYSYCSSSTQDVVFDTKGVSQQGAEENICTYEKGNFMKLKKKLL
jgi:hypothetical protein